MVVDVSVNESLVPWRINALYRPQLCNLSDLRSKSISAALTIESLWAGRSGFLRFALIAFLTLLSVHTQAADCSQQDITLSTQVQVDSFQADYGPCDRVSGNISVSGTDITDIDGLAGLTNVGGWLSIDNNPLLANLDGLINLNVVKNLSIQRNDVLTNIDGLASLVSVGLLFINSNPSLIDIDGLSGLSSIGDYVRISENDRLANINGLSQVAYVAGGLEIKSNPALIDLNGLSSLTSVGIHPHWSSNGNQLVITANSSLSNVDGLSNLTSVGYWLEINSNPLLTDITLPNLSDAGAYIEVNSNPSLVTLNMAEVTGVAGRLEIKDNPSLANLDLSSLSSVGDWLEITDNTSLTTLDGLSALSSVGKWFWITSNDSLVNIDGLSNLTNQGGDLRIWSNAALTNLDGLSGLTTLNRDLSIYGNTDLISIDGLSGINTIVGYVAISTNNSLKNLDGLLNLADIGGALTITSNSNMADCTGIAILLGWKDGPPNDGVTKSISIESNATGCNSIEEILASVAGPTQPVIAAVNPGEESLELVFNEPTADRLYPVTGYEAACSRVIDSSGPAASVVITDNETIESTISVTGVQSAGASAFVEVDIDIIHDRMRHLVITLTSPQGTELTLWNLGVDPSADLSGTFPTAVLPVDDFGIWATEHIIGEWLLKVTDTITGYEGTLNSWNIRVTESSAVIGNSSPITVSGLVNDQEYSCAVSPITLLGVFPQSSFVGGTPETLIRRLNIILIKAAVDAQAN